MCDRRARDAQVAGVPNNKSDSLRFGLSGTINQHPKCVNCNTGRKHHPQILMRMRRPIEPAGPSFDEPGDCRRGLSVSVLTVILSSIITKAPGPSVKGFRGLFN